MSLEQARLNIREQKLLDEFLTSADEIPMRRRYVELLAGGVTMIGLFLFVKTVLIAIDRLNQPLMAELQDAQIWMFFAGILGGSGIIAAALLYLMKTRNLEDKKQLGSIVRRLKNSVYPPAG